MYKALIMAGTVLLIDGGASAQGPRSASESYVLYKIGQATTDVLAAISATAAPVISVNNETGRVTTATVAQGAKADTALQPGATNGFVTATITNGLLSAESDVTALAAISALQPRDWYSSDGTRWLIHDNGVQREYSRTVVTNWFANTPSGVRYGELPDDVEILASGTYPAPMVPAPLTDFSDTVFQGHTLSWNGGTPYWHGSTFHSRTTLYGGEIEFLLEPDAPLYQGTLRFWTSIYYVTNLLAERYALSSPTQFVGRAEFASAQTNYVDWSAFYRTNSIVAGLAEQASLDVFSLDAILNNSYYTRAETTNQASVIALAKAAAATNWVPGTLIGVITNSMGSTTGALYRATGGGTNTYFFSQASTPSYNSAWQRPSNWPVASGYTVDSWLIPETNWVKIVTQASACESIFFLRGAGGNYQVDWYGDGSAVSNYANNTLARYSYPTNYWGKLIAYKAGYANGLSVESVSNFRNYSSDAVQDDKTAELLELIMSSTNRNMGVSLFQGCYNLKHVITHSPYIAGNTFYGPDGIEKCEAPYALQFGSSAFYNNIALREVYCPLITNVQASCFASSYIFDGVFMPGCQYLGNQAFYGCQRLKTLSPMPNLRAVGTEVFRNCNLDKATISNFVANLPTVTPYQNIDFRDNPGVTEAKAWYFSGSVSNTLDARGWKVTF